MKAIKTIAFLLAIAANCATFYSFGAELKDNTKASNVTAETKFKAMRSIIDTAQSFNNSCNIHLPDKIRNKIAKFPGLANTRYSEGPTFLTQVIDLDITSFFQGLEPREAFLNPTLLTRWGKVTLPELLLEDPETDVTISDLQGNTPLHHIFLNPQYYPKNEREMTSKIKHMEALAKQLLARGASPVVRNRQSASVLDLIKQLQQSDEVTPIMFGKMSDLIHVIRNYAKYTKLLFKSARECNLNGVQLALTKGNVCINVQNTDLADADLEIPAAEHGNTPFHAALLGALDKYEKLMPQINVINQSRNEGFNKFIRKSHFDEQISQLRAPIDNVIRLIKILNPDIMICNMNGETIPDLLMKASLAYPGAMLFEILAESREQSMNALKAAGIIRINS